MSTTKVLAIVLAVSILLLILLAFFMPYSLVAAPVTIYTVERGSGYKEIGDKLQQQGFIRNALFFDAYVLLLGKAGKLQAGTYELSPSLSIAQVVHKLVSGDTAKHILTIIEGWDIKDISSYIENKNIFSPEDFIAATKQDHSETFSFLKDKPKKLSLEGYLFPDTYNLALNASAQDLILATLRNFDKKLTSDLRSKIQSQKKSIFQIITMASMLEKEVRSLEDKKTVAGILWKRINAGMPLQVDATVNYATGKTSGKVSIEDTTIDSPYNTYKYYGLPLGPISNPGLESIVAAIEPIKSEYWYYLSAPDGTTIFSKTAQEHAAAVEKYLR